MIVKYYAVTLITEPIRSERIAEGEPVRWEIAARDMTAAWSKFKHLYLPPVVRDILNPADYDIHYSRMVTR